MAIRKRVSIRVYTYSHRSRSRINGLAKRFLSETSLAEHDELIATCINELLTNAVKANYRHVLMAEGSESPPPHDDGSVSARVRQILNEQARFNNIMDRAYAEERPVTAEERSLLSELTVYNAASERMRRGNIISLLTLALDDRVLRLRVSNAAPILESDLDRISEKLGRIRMLRDQGRQEDFFSQYIDTSQGGFGLGYALIDSCCMRMGVDLQRALTIRTGAETEIEIEFPLHCAAVDPGEVEFIEVA